MVYGFSSNSQFEDETFGYIVSFHTFEHIAGDPLEILKEWVRVLVPGGLLVIIIPDKRHFLHNSEVTENGKAAYHEMEPKELYALVMNYNFDNKDKKAEVLLFNSRKNNFDFDIIIRKVKKPSIVVAEKG